MFQAFHNLWGIRFDGHWKDNEIGFAVFLLQGGREEVLDGFAMEGGGFWFHHRHSHKQSNHHSLLYF
ncbi:hypothetical protein CH361_14245 [Leptospira brenneri]|nr:hypothetical protein CH361_14245 [Leptospira brenneri]